MFMFINSTHTYFHESIHQEICDNFGGISSVEYSFLMQGGITKCTTEEGAIYHTINDIVSYSASILVLTIFMCLICVAAFIEKQSILNRKERLMNLHLHQKLK